MLKQPQFGCSESLNLGAHRAGIWVLTGPRFVCSQGRDLSAHRAGIWVLTQPEFGSSSPKICPGFPFSPALLPAVLWAGARGSPRCTQRSQCLAASQGYFGRPAKKTPVAFPAPSGSRHTVLLARSPGNITNNPGSRASPRGAAPAGPGETLPGGSRPASRGEPPAGGARVGPAGGAGSCGCCGCLREAPGAAGRASPATRTCPVTREPGPRSRCPPGALTWGMLRDGPAHPTHGTRPRLPCPPLLP